MTTVTTKAAEAPPDPFDEKKPRYVLGWAFLGAICFGCFVYTKLGWILSGDIKRIEAGPTPMPAYMHVTHWAWQIVGTSAAVWLTVRYLIRPWRRDKHISHDGLCLLAFLTLTWLDTAVNFFQVQFSYNAVFFNFGGWDRWVPGWFAPNGNLILQPFPWDFTFYFWGGFGMMILGGHFLRKVKARWPQATFFRLLVAAWVFGFVVDLIVEPLLWIIPGAFAWLAPIPWLTLFHGTRFQYPIYEPILAGFYWAAFAALGYWRNDRGDTIAERGIDEVPGSRKKKAWIRWLALVGIVNIMTIVTYMAPMAVLGLYGGPVPPAIQKLSYFMNGLCGPDTEYACPSPGTPVNRDDSSHVNPEGELVEPDNECDPGGCAGNKVTRAEDREDREDPEDP